MCNNPNFFETTLLKRESIGSNYNILTFAFDENIKVNPGQFLMIRGKNWDVPFLSRPMSILYADKNISIMIKTVGKGTDLLSKALPDDLFLINVPLGIGWDFVDEFSILVAGGIGICPLIFLSKSLSNKVVLYGAKTKQDLLLLDEFNKEELFISTDDGSFGEKGLITNLLSKTLQNKKAKVYTCGTNAMMKNVVKICNDYNVPCQVSLESIMGCGFGVCLGCAIPKTNGGYLYACKEAPCVDGNVVDWSKIC